MIVENQTATIEHANEISNQLTSVINKEVKKFVSNDPAEHIYLVCHTAANFLARMCLTLEGYGTIYGISNLTLDEIFKWVEAIAREHIKINSREKNV